MSNLLMSFCTVLAMRIKKTKAGEVSDDPAWTIIHNGYFYIAPTLFSVLLMYIREYKHDKHLVE